MSSLVRRCHGPGTERGARLPRPAKKSPAVDTIEKENSRDGVIRAFPTSTRPPRLASRSAMLLSLLLLLLLLLLLACWCWC